MMQQDGFSAVELLITLFVASIFLIGANQLSIQVTKDAADTDKNAKVSNVVYAKLRKLRFDTTQDVGCNATTVPSQQTESVSISGISGSVSLTTDYSCPYTDVGVYKIIVTASYSDNGVTRIIRHATYTN